MIEADAAVSARVEAMIGEQRRMLGVVLKQTRKPQAPTWVDFWGSAVSDSLGSSLLIVPRQYCPQGYIWHVRRWVFSGPSTITSVAGVGNVYLGSGEPATVTQGDRPESWIDSATLGLPQPAFYGHGEAVIKAPGRCYAIVTGPTASTTYVFGGTAEQVPDEEYADVETAL